MVFTEVNGFSLLSLKLNYQGKSDLPSIRRNRFSFSVATFVMVQGLLTYGTEKEREADTRWVPVHWFTPQCLQQSGVGKAEAGAQNPLQIGGRGPVTLSHHFCLPRSTLAGTWSQEWSLDLNLDTALWGVGVPNGILTAGPGSCP